MKRKSIWFYISILELLIITAGIILVFIWLAIKAGELPTDLKGALSFIASLGISGGMFFGLIGWGFVAEAIYERYR